MFTSKALFRKLLKNCKAVLIPAVEISTGREGLTPHDDVSVQVQFSNTPRMF
jgi:hypothetical protein